MERHRPPAGLNPDSLETLINSHDFRLFTSSSEVVDTRENADRMNRWEAELAGFQSMARTRSRIRVILILLLGTSLACFPARPLPLLGSSLPSLRHSLDHLSQKPQRLRMFHSGLSTDATDRRTERRSEQRPARVNRSEQATAVRARIAEPSERIASALPVHPLRC